MKLINLDQILFTELFSKLCNTQKGTWNFDSMPMAQGVYIVVFKNQNEIVSQQKLIKN